MIGWGARAPSGGTNALGREHGTPGACPASLASDRLEWGKTPKLGTDTMTGPAQKSQPESLPEKGLVSHVDCHSHSREGGADEPITNCSLFSSRGSSKVTAPLGAFAHILQSTLQWDP